jgi:uncharacterized membrane protein YdjX (TVP38/TMEM64 family)
MKPAGAWKRVGLAEALILAAVGAGVLLVFLLHGDSLTGHIQIFEHWVAALGLWAFVVYILAYLVLASLVFPESLLGVAAGVIFDFFTGFVVLICANVLAVMLQYALAKRWLKPRIDKALVKRPTFALMQTAVLQQQFKLQFLIRLTPLNRALVSYVLGAAGVRLLPFLCACVAMLPSLALEVYFGYTSNRIAQRDSSSHTFDVHDAALIAGLVIALCVALVVANIARKAVEKVGAEAQGKDGAISPPHAPRTTSRAE